MMPSYYLRRPSTTYKWIYLVDGVEYAEKARPQHPWAGWTYTADELEQMDYEGFEPVEVKMENKVSVLTINKIMDAAEITAKIEFGKVTIVSAKLPNGFVIAESSGAVSPENYDFEMGKKICLKRIRDKVWDFEGYKLASELFEEGERDEVSD